MDNELEKYPKLIFKLNYAQIDEGRRMKWSGTHRVIRGERKGRLQHQDREEKEEEEEEGRRRRVCELKDKTGKDS